MITKRLQISCDEAGHTGPDLLHADQRFFGFGSVAIPDAEAREIIQRVVRNHRVQMPELKAARLFRSTQGQALISELVKAADARFAVNVYEKLLALCAWFFEYVYEPVFRDNTRLLYGKNFHRFVTMVAWCWFNGAGGAVPQALGQFQKYMRSQNENDAPLLFKKINLAAPPADGADDPFELILRFARGYREIIVADNSQIGAELPDAGRWVLDLSASALWSHLNHWGRSGQPLGVWCDASKPLQAIIAQFTGDEKDPGIKRARTMHQHGGSLGWRLAEPVSFVDSRNHPAVQLADVIAGTTVACLVKGVPKGLEETVERIQHHMLKDTILPDFDVIDFKKRAPAINSIVLYGLAQRAERGDDPCHNLEQIYRAAEMSWDRNPFFE
jgi:hypothetical protein